MKSLFILFFLLSFSIFFITSSKNSAYAISCQGQVTDYTYDCWVIALDPGQYGWTYYGNNCPTKTCSTLIFSPEACYKKSTTTTKTWTCSDPVCGSALSCPRSYTWSTCGDNPGSCNTFTTTDSPACQCAVTCAESNGTCTFDSQCQPGTSEIFGSVCSDASQICCTQPAATPTPTPPPPPPFCTPNVSTQTCTTTDNCAGTQTCNALGTGFNSCVKNDPNCPIRYDCKGQNNSCIQWSGGPYTTSNCNNLCPTACLNAPTYAPSTSTTFSATCDPVGGSSCPVPCTKTCTDVNGVSCNVSGVEYWNCINGTQWFTNGVCSAVCPTLCVTPTPTPAPTLPPPGSCTYTDIRCPSSCQGGGTYASTGGQCIEWDEIERPNGSTRVICTKRAGSAGCYDANNNYCGQPTITNRYCTSSNYWGSACNYTWWQPNNPPLCGNDQWGCYCPSWALGYPITVDCTSTNNSNYGNYCHNTTPGDDSTCGPWSGPACGTQTRTCKTTNCNNCSATRQVCSLTISGNVFVDANQNGVKDGGEAGYSGAVLSDGYSSTTTDTSGNYAFSSLQAGNYAVTLTLPTNYDSTTTNPLVVSLTTDNQTVANFGIARNDNWSVAGNIFIDINNNKIKDAGEQNYSGSFTIGISPSSGAITYSQPGQYLIEGITKGTYTVSYTNPPAGYAIAYPVNGPPPSFTIGLGPCNPGGSNSASCQGQRLVNLNFGINYLQPWIQCIGADCRIDSGFISKIPQGATCGAYANLPGSGGTPGLIFTGTSNADFGQGQASSTGWVVGGSDPTISELYSPTKVGGQIKTSYNFLLAKATQGSLPINDLASYCAGGIGNCTLNPSLPNGVYRANGNLKLVGGGYTFNSNKNYVILVNGDLTIAEKIFIPLGSNSTAIFSASGNILVDKSVGEASFSSTAADIAGVYSADKSFIVQGTNDCSIATDLRFNVGGSVITSAGSAGGGSFQNQRNICEGDAQCPAFSVSERPDLLLNSPEFLKQPNFTYQEVAP